eukprot:Plantae.Rhodophyta-Rhodochaete_pulchella.ctg439.p1 GENE.Plantae.Rhodophyta-Rhodochaete_pulchella.ctg439~~Plantae.Rhodophyta-Rhodochaete_pulchella.ctg439.p1  ORF type:complete len:247 (-),score=53.34 Plantae.Rhodophyta-Rhodochaete_pulchella.ctg439:995-1735(-)
MAPSDKENAPTLYDMLGVSSSALPKEITQAYRRAALRVHPDKNPQNTDEATRNFHQLQRAYKTLIDGERRRLYDKTGAVYGDEEVGDEDFSTSDFLARFNAQRTPITEKDIQAFQQHYVHGKEEEQDLRDFFNRFDGKVDRVIEYIPFSGDDDLARFVQFWDKELEEGNLPEQNSYSSARLRLLQVSATSNRKQSKTKRKDTKAKASLEALQAAISTRAEERARRFESLTEDLQNRYTSNDKKRKR